MINNYRIKRTDARNIAIQQLKGKRWISISYHGNSLNSLISGLFGLIASDYTPETDKLYGAIVNLQLELIIGLEKIEEIVKRDCEALNG